MLHSSWALHYPAHEYQLLNHNHQMDNALVLKGSSCTSLHVHTRTYDWSCAERRRALYEKNSYPLVTAVTPQRAPLNHFIIKCEAAVRGTISSYRRFFSCSPPSQANMKTPKALFPMVSSSTVLHSANNGSLSGLGYKPRRQRMYNSNSKGKDNTKVGHGNKIIKSCGRKNPCIYNILSYSLLGNLLPWRWRDIEHVTHSRV